MHFRTLSAKLLLLAILGALAAAAVYGWLFYRVLAMRDDVAELSSTIDVRAQEEERLRAVEGVLNATEEERTELSAYFVQENTVVPFIEMIEGLGASAGVGITISSVDTEEEESNEPLQYLQVRLAAVGSWRNVIHFTSLVDALPFVIEIQSVGFERSGVASSEWKGLFTFRVAMIK